MKRIFMILICAMFLVACGSDDTSISTIKRIDKNKVYVTDCTAPRMVKINKNKEITWYSDEITRNADKKKSVNVCGVEYTGDYQYSQQRYTTSYITDLYETEDGVKFGFWGERLVYFNIYDQENYFENEYVKDDCVLSDSQAKEVADSVAEKVLDNFSDYEVSVREMGETENVINGKEYRHNTYNVRYVKKISGIDSFDELSVYINSKGGLVTFNARYLGGFDKYNIEVDGNEIEECTIEYIKANAEMPENAEISIQWYRIVETIDGELGVDVAALISAKQEGKYGEEMKQCLVQLFFLME